MEPSLLYQLVSVKVDILALIANWAMHILTGME